MVGCWLNHQRVGGREKKKRRTGTEENKEIEEIEEIEEIDVAC